MIQYPALIDGEAGAYGVVFPDLDGITAMGATVAEAIVNAQAALQDYVYYTELHGRSLASPSALEAVDVPEGSSLTTVMLAK